MYSIKNFEYDCTHKCRLQEHGNLITAALTKRTMPDEQLAAYIAKTCCNFCDVVDNLGRSAVHLSASVARYTLLEWLLNQGPIINGSDFESGSSPLHRALFYGAIDCAVLLLRYGASLDLLDADMCCPLQSICRISDFRTAKTLNDILVWGSNKNYNLGIGSEQNANTPRAVDFFRKDDISIENIALGTYHSLFLDNRKRLYAVGHGKGGRLGVANENSLPAPQKVKVPLKAASGEIKCISVSSKHSLVLTTQSLVFACGRNEDQQLGVRDAGDQLVTFKEVVALRNAENLIEVIACDYHSMAYSEKSIYVWGTNNGQFLTSLSNKFIAIPALMKLPAGVEINFVVANNAATVIYTNDCHILLCYNTKYKTIIPPNYEKLKSISIVGGDNKNSTKGTATALKILLLSTTNIVFIWYENTQSFHRCNFAPFRLMHIDKILFKTNQVLILAQGVVYMGKCHQVELPVCSKSDSKTNIGWQDKNLNRNLISRNHIIRIDLKRVPNIDRAVNIFSNDDFSSFAVLQESCMKYFRPPVWSTPNYNFKQLYHDACITDPICDIIFHVDGETFAAHKFIIFARSPGLRDIIKCQQGKNVYLNFKLLTGKMFELILKYIYTDYFPNIDDINCIRQSLGPDSPEDNSKVCEYFCAQLDRFKLVDYLMHFKRLYVDSYYTSINKSFNNLNHLRRKDFPELYDVRIICESQREIQAHKCILVARLEYFNMMFMHTWSEQSVINLSTVPIEYVEPIIDFLYSADAGHFRKQDYSETYLYQMIIYCDQFFVEHLQGICELMILKKITIRKCGEMLDFACIYNCKLLREGCMDFICQNLARVLAQRSLEQCEPDALKCLNEHYKKVFKNVFDYRMITPDSQALEDEMLLSYVDDFTVDLSYRLDEAAERKLALSQKQKVQKSKQNVRQYEREAISNMKRTLNLSEAQNQITREKLEVELEAENISNQIQNDSNIWYKVIDKREQKRKANESISQIVSVPKLNESLTRKKVLNEQESAETTIPAGAHKQPDLRSEKTTTIPAVTIPSVKNYDIDFSNLAKISNQKLSQKQRKRLSSESKATGHTTSQGQEAAVAVPSVAKTISTANAWSTLPSSPPACDSILSTPPTGSNNDPTSFANIIRSQAVGAAASKSTNNFTQILADERRERDQYERMRNKSLALTQIEETAIAELREFYNADNISDEYIIIERKIVPSTTNFSTWPRQ